MPVSAELIAQPCRNKRAVWFERSISRLVERKFCIVSPADHRHDNWEYLGHNHWDHANTTLPLLRAGLVD